MPPGNKPLSEPMLTNFYDALAQLPHHDHQGTPGFEISLARLSETCKNDSRTSGIPAGLVRRTRLCISDFHICCIDLIFFRQVNGTFGQMMFTIHLPDGQVQFEISKPVILSEVLRGSKAGANLSWLVVSLDSLFIGDTIWGGVVL